MLDGRFLLRLRWGRFNGPDLTILSFLLLRFISPHSVCRTYSISNLSAWRLMPLKHQYAGPWTDPQSYPSSCSTKSAERDKDIISPLNSTWFSLATVHVKVLSFKKCNTAPCVRRQIKWDTSAVWSMEAVGRLLELGLFKTASGGRLFINNTA